MGVKMVMTGNSATAWGSRLARAEVISAYPITPQTTVVEKIAEFRSTGDLDAEYIKVESEHSAMASCISASQTGVRTFTATSSHGLLLMHEMLHWAACARAPVGLVNVNRAVGPPWSIWTDQTDSYSQRDTGIMQVYVESAQEILDLTIQGFKVGEDKDVLLPYMVNADAFFLSHTFEPVELPDQDKVDEFLPKYENPWHLDVDKPLAFGSLSMPHQWYMELRYNMVEAMNRSREKWRQADKDYERLIGRGYGGLIEAYRCDDADAVLFCVGTVATTGRTAVDQLRDEGLKVGMAKVRIFRPWPYEEVRAIADRTRMIGVLDRGHQMGFTGTLCAEVKQSLYQNKNRPPVKNYIMGVGGRDVTVKHMERLLRDMIRVKDEGLDKEEQWIDLKTPEGVS